MPLTPYPFLPPSFALIRLEFTLDGAAHDPNIIFGLDVDGATDASVIASQTHNAWNVAVQPDLSTSCVCVGAHCVLNHAGALSEGDSTTAAVAGGTGGQPVPPNTSILWAKGTGLIGKHFRGRMYVPGCPASKCDSAQANITVPFQAQMQTDADAFLTALNGLTTPLALLHRSPAVSPTAVTTLFAERLLATQSRRLRKVAHR